VIGQDIHIDPAALARAVQETESIYGARMVGALSVFGFRSVAFLRSLTGEIRPPARRGEGTRAAHPGHWADITSQLALSYGFEVRDGAGHTIRERVATVRTSRGPFWLRLFNDAEYAKYLENRHGYWVLSGFTMPGAEGERFLRESINAVEGMRVA
jgi:hypothetical protein